MGRIGAMALLLIGIVLFNILGHCEMSIYPGLRRKPLHQSLQGFEVPSDFLAQLMEENARRRLQQQFEQQLELINMQMNLQRQRQEQRERYRLQLQEAQEAAENEENDEEDSNNNNINSYDQYDNSNPDFSFKYPNVELDDGLLRERTPFAFGPTDPRFFEEENREDVAMDEYEEYSPVETKQTVERVPPPSELNSQLDPVLSESSLNNINANIVYAPAPVLAPAPIETTKVLNTSSTTTFHRIKPQNAAAVAVAGVNVALVKPNPNIASPDLNNRHDISALIDKLQKEGKSGGANINSHETTLGHDEHMVLRQHLGMDREMGMYVVALIAGVSAAVTVGLIALGIAWYTLHNKTKAAADVEYPAYGVTGPNKDISPSGDRKLAQSAQMYHYQHQKQQIIAMENRQAVEGSCGLSDLESDDDNEEGDYTVYECPGLAPTGEMEVKNPLFLDETPLTPASNITTTSVPQANITQATPQQPQTIRKSSEKSTTSMITSSEEKKKKNKK